MEGETSNSRSACVVSLFPANGWESNGELLSSSSDAPERQTCTSKNKQRDDRRLRNNGTIVVCSPNVKVGPAPVSVMLHVPCVSA
jgi:hypothetical protein